MAKNVTKRDFESLARRYESAKTKVKSAAQKGEKVIAFAVTSMEVGAVSFGLGMAHGYWVDEETGESGLSLFNVPAELIGFLGLGLGSMFMGKKWQGHAQAMAQGALATYSTVRGVAIGAKMRAERPAEAATAGDRGGKRNLPTGRASGPTGAQLRGLAQRVRR